MTEYLDWKADPDNPVLAETYDEMSFWAARFGNLLMENIALRKGICGLDIGCGTGFPLLELARRHGVSSEFIGVDIWRHALNRAEMKRRGHDVSNAAIVRADAGGLPFSDESFDLVVSNLGINNFDNPAAVLYECRRVARPGARLVLTTNVLGHMREFYEVFRGVLKEMGTPEDLKRLDLHEQRRSTRDGLVILLQAAGFTASRVVQSTFHLRFLDGSALFRDHLIRIGFLDAWKRVVDPDRTTALFETLEERLNAEAEKAGGLTLTVPMLYLESVRSEAGASGRPVEMT